eukprot:jgi/Astpho2/1772/fgenesh1_pg.00036_%23_1_t
MIWRCRTTWWFIALSAVCAEAYSSPNFTNNNVMNYSTVATPSDHFPLVVGTSLIRRLQQAAAPAPAVRGPVNGQGEDSVDVHYTLIAPTSDAIYPTLGSAFAVYNAEVEDDLLAQGWQVAAFAMQIMLAEGALDITSRLNVEPMAAASITLTVKCIRCCVAGPCLSKHLFPNQQMSGPSVLPFDLDRQNTVLLELSTQMVVPAGVNSVRPVQDLALLLPSIVTLTDGYVPPFALNLAAAGMPNTSTVVSNVVDGLPNGTGSVPAFIAGDLGSQLISLGPDDANMKHEDIALCRNEQGRPIKLGQGGFGKVYKAMKCGVQPIAVKLVHGTDRRQLSAFVKEIAMLKQLSFDKNILQYYGAFQVCGTPVLVKSDGGPCPLCCMWSLTLHCMLHCLAARCLTGEVDCLVYCIVDLH